MNSDVVGKTLAGFRVTGLLGKGGMGSVYKAHDMQLERDVALKLMDPALAHDDTFMKRFRVEAKALAQLNNPHIVKVHALQDTEQGVCIVMEFVRGTTLAEMIKASGALEIKRVVNLFRQILSAFDYAHKAGVLHRDIKPSNIMVTESGEIKVTDFGLAKLHRGPSTTVTQLTGGTLYYVSPEQLDGLANVDHRGDIYSIGMTLFEALTGTVPFEKTESDFRIRERIVKGKVQPPRSFNASISKPLNDLVMKAIARVPEDRFQSVEEMRTAFERVAATEVQVAGGLKPATYYRNVAAIALGVCVLLIATLFVYKYLHPTGGDLTITTLPAEARIRINGAELGNSPLRDFQISPGEIHVLVEKENYVPIDTQFSIESGGHLAVTLALTPMHFTNKKSSGEVPSLETATGQHPFVGRNSEEEGKAASRVTEKRDARTKADARASNGGGLPARGSTGSGEETERRQAAEKAEAAKLEADRLEVEKLERERRSAEELARARTGLQNLVEQYRTAFESSDLGSLTSLLRFSEKEEEAWSKFFELARNVKVKVDDLDVQNSTSTGDVAFKARLSYVNTSKGEVEQSTVLNSWKCENVHGKWVVVSRK